MHCFFAPAPWPPSLKAVSLFGTIGLVAASYAAWRAIPASQGFTHAFGLGVAFVPVLVLGGAVLGIVRGYAVESAELRVRRLLWSTRIPLAGLERAWSDPEVQRDSKRAFGNGGLYSYSGWFHSRRLGWHRVRVTDLRRAVVVRFADRAIVVSPAAPDAFIGALRRAAPRLRVGPPADVV